MSLIHEADRLPWMGRVKDFEGGAWQPALIQIADTLLPYLACLTLLLYGAQAGLPWWIVILGGIPTGGFLVRTFILFHDCCHGSFLPNRKANEALGFVLGLLCFTPFADWRRSHGIHHRTTGLLDDRGMGDVWTMTVEEFRAAPSAMRFIYRFYRNPVTLFVLGPFFIFLLVNRLPSKGAGKRQLRDLAMHNVLLLAIGFTLCLLFGPGPFFLAQLSALFFGGLAGIWMFYVQHQFDSTYWARGAQWSFLDAALVGSSWYSLPPPLQWFTGNIGFHHVHHLSPRIPNYRLEECLRSIPELGRKEKIGIIKSLGTISMKLWDEKSGKLLSFRSLRDRASPPM